MSVDNLSISFASSIGIDNIKEEHLKNNLYTDLDQLEKSVDAEFEQYMNQARSFPFQEEQEQEHKSHEHPDLKDASVHSDYEILGAELLGQVNDELDLDNESWHRYLENNDVDENYKVKPLRNNTNGSLRKEEIGIYSGNTSPGEYFGARSLPLDSLYFQQEDEKSFPLGLSDSPQGNKSFPLDSSDSRQDMSFPLDSSDLQDKSFPPDLPHFQQDQSFSSNPSDFQQEQSQEVNLSFTSSIEEKRVKTRMEKLLEKRFKSLPKSLGLFPRYDIPEIELHHPYTQKKKKNNRSVASSISSTRQQCSSRDQQRISNSSRSFQDMSRQTNDECTIEPTSLHFLCEISPKTIYAKVIHLKITNPSPNTVRNFSIFSSRNLLEFEVTEGMILEHEVVQVVIKIQSSALLSYRRQQTPLDKYPSLHDKLLVLIDRQQAIQLDVNIDFMSLEDDDEDDAEEKECGRPKCRYCALEKGYPLHSF